MSNFNNIGSFYFHVIAVKLWLCLISNFTCNDSDRKYSGSNISTLGIEDVSLVLVSNLFLSSQQNQCQRTSSEYDGRPAIKMSSGHSNVVSSANADIMDYEAFRKTFDKAYNAWFRTNFILPELRAVVESYEITADQFEKLTENRQFQRYISLIDGKVRFDELPGPPHGAIIGELTNILGRQLVVQIMSGSFAWSVMMVCVMVDLLTINIDVRVNNRSVKRPDASFKIRRTQIPAPPPNWLKTQPNGHPYPNVVVEVTVNNEGPQNLLADMQRYFFRRTSVRVWIGVRYWAAGRKFWVGWAERRPAGLGGRLHTQMQWPPNHSDISVATNIVYNIPMATIFGPNIPMPPGLPPILTVDTDAIRTTILEEV